MKAFVSALLLLSTSAFAVNSFPPCNGTFINEVWRAQDGSYWYCTGSSWVAVTGYVDGGYVDLTTAQTAAGNKTWTGDAGFALNVSVGGTETIAVAKVTSTLGVDGGSVLRGVSNAENVRVSGGLGVDGGVVVTGSNVSIATGELIINNGVESINVLQNSSVIQIGSGASAQLYGDGTGIVSAGVFTIAGAEILQSALNKGTLLLDGGSPTATVASGAVCVCGNVAPLDGGTVHNTTCTVASTTMTATGNKGDTISYVCF